MTANHRDDAFVAGAITINDAWVAFDGGPTPIRDIFEGYTLR